MGVVVASACAEDADNAESPSVVEATLTPQDLTRDVTPGETSEYVGVVQRYLQRYGYLPNAALAEKYPSWRPIVSEEPRAGTYDATTEVAVSALQRSLGLDETGVVDEVTRQHMQRRRCPHPEGEHQLDPRDKWDLQGSKRQGRTLSWSFSIGDETSISAADAMEGVAAAFAQHAFVTGLQFPRVDSSADLVVTFEPMDNALGKGSFPSTGNTLTFSSTSDWITDRTGGVGEDIEQVAVHEIGHLLGLNHSSDQESVMWGESDKKVLTIDDQLALRVLYNEWPAMGGVANDVAVTPDNHVWTVGGDVPFATFKLNDAGDQWIPAPVTTPDNRAVEAVLLTVDSGGRPWVVDFNGQIFTFSSSDPTNGQWVQRPGECAKDIGSSAAGATWIISCLPGDGGHQVMKWDGNAFQAANFAAARIAVDDTGCPWVVTDKGDVYRTDICNNLQTMKWERLSFDPQGSRFTGPVARDIAVAAANPRGKQAWIVDTQGRIWLWNEQVAKPVGDPPARERRNWVAVAPDLAPTNAFHISVSPTQAWVITDDGGITVSGPGIWR